MSNSSRQKWLEGLQSRRTLIQRARDSDEARAVIVLNCQLPARRYLEFLLRHDRSHPTTQAGAEHIAVKIWRTVILGTIVEELTKGWVPKKGWGFRDELWRWISDAYELH